MFVLPHGAGLVMAARSLRRLVPVVGPGRRGEEENGGVWGEKGAWVNTEGAVAGRSK